MHVKNLVVSLLFASYTAYAGTAINVGQTYPIAEPDTLEEIKRNASSVDWKAWMRKEPTEYSAFKGAKLPRTQADSVRLVDPTYTLEREIADANGRVIFPKGTKVNVLERAKFPGRFIIINGFAEELEWLDTLEIVDQDRLILTGNSLFSENIKGSKYTFLLLSDRMIERFQLKSAPAIVKQSGAMYEVSAYAIY